MPLCDHDTLARALLCVARERSDPVLVDNELAEIERVLASVPLLSRLLADPGLPASERREVVTDVFGGTLSAVSLGLLDLLIDEDDPAAFGVIVQTYRRLMREDAQA